MKRTVLLPCLFLVCIVLQARDRQNFDRGWRFLLADTAVMASPDYNDAHWRTLDLPHDWAVEGDFMATNPSGAGGGALPGGVGWYRKHFKMENGKDGGKEKPLLYFLEFDGV